jgi:hypothetical protein
MSIRATGEPASHRGRRSALTPRAQKRYPRLASVIDKKRKRKAKAATQQLGIEFVPIANVRDWQWRGENMHHNASVLCTRLMKVRE